MQAATTASDLELAEQAAHNDQGAFGALYERHLAALYDYARRLMRDADEAGDVVQVAFIKAFESIRRTGTAPGTFRSWLFQIAHNEAFDRLRRNRFVDPEGEEALAGVPDPSVEASPETLAERRETADLVWRAVRGLRPEEQELLVLSLREGLDAGEIAQVTGKRREAVHVALSRVRDAFEDAYTALALLAQGARDCPELAALASGVDLSPRLRRLVRRHVEQCDICAENRRRCAQEMAAFAVLAPFRVPTDVKAAMWRQIGEHLNTPVSGAPHRHGRLKLLRAGTRGGARPWWTLLAVVAIPLASLALAVRVGVGRLPAADVVETPTSPPLEMVQAIATPVFSPAAEATPQADDEHLSDVVTSVALEVVKPEQSSTSEPTPGASATPEAPSMVLQPPTVTMAPSAGPSPVEPISEVGPTATVTPVPAIEDGPTTPEATQIPNATELTTATAGPAETPNASPDAPALFQTVAVTPTAPPPTRTAVPPAPAEQEPATLVVAHTLAVPTATSVPPTATPTGVPRTSTATGVPPTATRPQVIRARVVTTLTPTPTRTRIPGA
jgi:RNA polymerase sigma factor (sigma-70 family)